jgi:archaellum component FlaC
MVEEFQSGREVGLALEAFRTSIDGQRDQLILMKWVIGGSSAVAVTIFAYLFAVNTQTTVTTARIESRFDLVDEHFRSAAERSDEQFKMVSEQFKTVNQQFKTVNQQFKTVNQRFEDLDQRLDERFKGVDEQFKVVNEQFKGVNEQFKGVDERFKAVDQRFKAVDQRFDNLQNTMNQRFETMQRTMDQRFDSVDKRLETLTTLITTLLPPKQKTEGFTLAPRLKNAL